MSADLTIAGHSVLYFPSIEFQDERWLRAALCIWDRVYRIVPPDYSPHDSDDVRRLADQDLIRPIDLSIADMNETTATFSALLNENGCYPSALSASNEEIHRLHRGKVGERLQDVFESMNGPLDFSDEWFGVPASVCHAYMSHLAEAVARRRNIRKVTDSLDTFSVAPFVDSDGDVAEYGYDPSTKQCHAALSLMTLVPSGVHEMPVQALLDFRDRTEEGRRGFCDMIQSAAVRLATIQDESMSQEFVADLRDGLEESSKIVRSKMTYGGQDLAIACVCCGIPAGLGAFGAAAAAGDPFTPLSLGAAGMVALISSMAYAYGQRKQQPVDLIRSYYLAMDATAERVNRAGSPRRGNAFWEVMEEYIND